MQKRPFKFILASLLLIAFSMLQVTQAHAETIKGRYTVSATSTTDQASATALAWQMFDDVLQDLVYDGYFVNWEIIFLDEGDWDDDAENWFHTLEFDVSVD